MVTEQQLQAGVVNLKKAPYAETCRRIDWQRAEVVSGFIKDTYFLTVRGKKPWVNMEVRLFPMIYVTRPEFWEIEVVGFLSGIGLPTETGYETTPILLTAASGLGSQGIRLVGATTSSDKIKVPPVGSFSPK